MKIDQDDENYYIYNRFILQQMKLQDNIWNNRTKLSLMLWVKESLDNTNEDLHELQSLLLHNRKEIALQHKEGDFYSMRSVEYAAPTVPNKSPFSHFPA